MTALCPDRWRKGCYLGSPERAVRLSRSERQEDAVPNSASGTGFSALYRDSREIEAVYQIVMPASLAGGAVFGLAGGLMVLAAQSLQLWAWGVAFFLVFLGLVTWAIHACLFAAPLVALLVPRGVMTADRLAWLPGRRACGMIGAGLGLAATGGAALVAVVLAALGWGEALAAQTFVPLAVGLIMAGISLGLRFHNHRSGAADAR